MTRKRYVKLLMSFGVSRNAANAAACIARRSYGSYSRALAQQYPLGSVILALRRAIMPIARMWRDLMVSLRRGVMQYFGGGA